MMVKMNQPELKLLYNDARLVDLFEALDELHNAASEGRVAQATTLSKTELVGWLRELAYIAGETIYELEQPNTAAGQPTLVLVKSPALNNCDDDTRKRVGVSRPS